MDFQYQCGDEVKTVTVERHGQTARITIADRVYEVSIIQARAGELTFSVAGAIHTACVVSEGSTQHIALEGDVFEVRKPEARRAQRTLSHGAAALTAPMPGQVTKVLINIGDHVQRGQPLLVLEAMKMEIKITAPYAGHVAQVLVQSGQVVDREQALIEMTNEQ